MKKSIVASVFVVVFLGLTLLYQNMSPVVSVVENHLQEAASLSAIGGVSVRTFGAVGNGVTDDTAAFQAAVNSSAIVFVPYTSTGYYISKPIVINHPILLMGLGSVTIRSGAETLFWVASSDVQILNFTLNLSAGRPGTAGIYLDTSVFAINRVTITDITSYGAYSVVADSPANAKTVVMLRMQRLNANGARGPQINLHHAWAFLYLKDSNFSYSSGLPVAPMINIFNNSGGIFDNIKLTGPGLAAFGDKVAGFSCSSCEAVWVSNSSAIGLNGPGFLFNQSRYLYLYRLTANKNLGSGFYFTGTRGNLTHIMGFALTANSNSQAGIRLVNAYYVQLTQSVANFNAGEGLGIISSSQVKAYATTVVSNKGWGIREAGGFSNYVSSIVVGGNEAGPFTTSGNTYFGVADLVSAQVDFPISSLGDNSLPFDMRTLLSKSNVVSIKRFGAKGDGVTDDTDAFTKAANSGMTVLIPPSNGAYVIKNPIVFRSAGTLFGIGRPVIKTGTETAFWIASSRVLLGGFYIDASMERDGTSAIYLDSTASALSSIRIRDITQVGGYSAVRDAPGGNGISQLSVERITSFNNTGPVFLFQTVKNFATFSELTADHVGATSPQSKWSFTLQNCSGALLEDLNVLGGPVGSYDPRGSFYVITNSQNIGMSRVMADTSQNAHGFWMAGISNLYMQNVVASLNRGAGMVLLNAKQVYGINTVLSGAGNLGYGFEDLWLQGVSVLQMSNTSTRYSSAPEPIKQVPGTVSNILFSNLLK